MIRFIKFLWGSMRLLYISKNLPYSFAWNTVVMSGLVFLASTWNCHINYKNGYMGLLVLFCCLFWTLGSSPKCSQLRHFLYFGRSSSDLIKLVPLPYSQGRSSRCFDKLCDFFVTISRCYRDVCINSFFLRLARL